MLSQNDSDSMQATIDALTPLITAYEGFNRAPAALSASAAIKLDNDVRAGRAAIDASIIPILQATNWPLLYGREVHDPLVSDAQAALVPFCRTEDEARQIAIDLHAVKLSAAKKSSFGNFENPGCAYSVAKMVVVTFTEMLAA
jgi:hypothetical protein